VQEVAAVWPFSRGLRVLTVGSVHLDTIALSSEADQANDGDTEIGNIIHSIGGSAYNIAANLAMHASGGDIVRSATVYSILPQHSVLTEIIKYKCASAGVKTSGLRLYKDFDNKRVRGGGYVGVLDEQKRLLRKAVVDAAMHEADIFADTKEAAQLTSAIRRADILVLDADLAISTVNRVSQHARHHEKPLFLSIGSMQAGMRTWLHSDSANRAVCIGGRLRVICEIIAKLKVPDTEIANFRAFVEEGDQRTFDVNRICRELKTKYIVCCNVRESKGFALLAAGETPYQSFFATPPDVRSRMQHGNSAGVVDAALAGFIRSYAELRGRGSMAEASDIVSEQTRKVFESNILDFVERASESQGATPGSVISFEEQVSQQSQLAKLWRLTRIAFDALPIFRVIASFIALIIAMSLIDIGLDLLDHFFGIKIDLPDKPWLRMLLRR
jgi:sugar/nucleoside kinase (ribokinase family)